MQKIFLIIGTYTLVCLSDAQVVFAQNIDAYCKNTYGSSFKANALNEKDAFSWRCSDGRLEKGVDVSSLCHSQYGSDYSAHALDMSDAFSWRCSKGDDQNTTAFSDDVQSVPSDIGCDNQSIIGYTAPPVGLKCVEAQIGVGPSAYAQTNSPPCPGDLSQEVNTFIKDQGSEAAGSAADSYAGPLADFAAKFLAGRTIDDLFGRLGWATTNSVCAPLCVKVPSGSSVLRVDGYARDQQSHNGMKTICGLGNDCGGIGWSGMEPMSRNGDVICTVAKNWSSDRQRDFGLFVYYK